MAPPKRTASRSGSSQPRSSIWAWREDTMGKVKAGRDGKGESQDKSGPAHLRIMPDGEAMKDQIRAQMIKPSYNVTMFYHKTGFSQWLARHPRFEQATLVVILLNAVWIAVDTDWNKADILLDAKPEFQLAEQLFCMYFSYEWTIRFLAFKRKLNSLKDAWFVFDSMLVFTMAFETWVMSVAILMSSSGSGAIGSPSILRIARLLRLSRMARMARLMRAMPELLILIKGMMSALRSVFFTLGLLFAIIYVFAIAFTQLCVDTPCGHIFTSVPTSMHQLWLNGALMDGVAALVKPLEEQSLVLLFVFYFFLLLAALTLMNMLIGVICEVVSAVAATERETMNLAYVKDKIKELLMHGDDDNDQMISKKEFMELLSNKQAALILGEVGVDVVGLVDFTDTIFEHQVDLEDIDGDEEEEEEIERSLTFAEFMNVILDLRGTNGATVRDIIDLRKHINSRLNVLEERVIDALQGGQPRFGRRQSTISLSRKASRNSVSSMSSENTGISIGSNPFLVNENPRCQLHESSGSRPNAGAHRDVFVGKDASQQLRTAMDEAVSKFLVTQAQEIASLKAEVQQLRQDVGKPLVLPVQRPNKMEAAPEPSRCEATCRRPGSSPCLKQLSPPKPLHFRQLQQAHDRQAQLGRALRQFGAILPEPQGSGSGTPGTTATSEGNPNRSWPGGFCQADIPQCEQQVRPSSEADPFSEADRHSQSGTQSRHPVTGLPGQLRFRPETVS